MSDYLVPVRILEILEHSVGGRKMYRNYFAAEPGSDDWSVIQEAVRLGYMRPGRDEPSGSGLQYYHVTEVGKSKLHLHWSTGVERKAIPKNRGGI